MTSNTGRVPMFGAVANKRGVQQNMGYRGLADAKDCSCRIFDAGFQDVEACIVGYIRENTFLPENYTTNENDKNKLIGLMKEETDKRLVMPLHVAETRSDRRGSAQE